MRPRMRACSRKRNPPGSREHRQHAQITLPSEPAYRTGSCGRPMSRKECAPRLFHRPGTSSNIPWLPEDEHPWMGRDGTSAWSRHVSWLWKLLGADHPRLNFGSRRPNLLVRWCLVLWGCIIVILSPFSSRNHIGERDEACWLGELPPCRSDLSSRFCSVSVSPRRARVLRSSSRYA